MTKPTLFLAYALVFATACAAVDVDRPVDAGAAARTPELSSTSIEDHLFTPARVLDHQAALSLTDEQRDAIVEDLRTTQAELVVVDARLRAERERLVRLLEAPRVDEAEAERASAALIEAEGQVKARHLAMLIRLRNRLTPDQRGQLERR